MPSVKKEEMSEQSKEAEKKRRLSINWKRPDKAQEFLQIWLKVSADTDKDKVYVQDLFNACEANGISLDAGRGTNAGNGECISAASVNKYKEPLIALFVEAGKTRGADPALMSKWEGQMMKQLKLTQEEKNLGKGVIVDNDFFKSML